LPVLYNNLHQIVQTKDTVMILTEMNHDARIVRINGKHAPSDIRSWLGDSIGWWEGDTLVVETRHFTPSDIGRVAAGITFLVSPDATVTERIERVAEDELSYVFTVDDPANYTQPWTGETHLMRRNEKMFEYACHEANYSLRFILQGGRAQDAGS
jgi:hypothetical protein